MLVGAGRGLYLQNRNLKINEKYGIMKENKRFALNIDIPVF